MYPGSLINKNYYVKIVFHLEIYVIHFSLMTKPIVLIYF